MLQLDKFNVSKLRVGFECPRLLYLKHHFDVKTQFFIDDRQQGIGLEFPRLAADFIAVAKQEPRFTDLFVPVVDRLERDIISSQMQQLFYEITFFPYLQTNLQRFPRKAAALHRIWQGLTNLIRHWTKLLVNNRRYCNADSLISRSLVAGEMNIEQTFMLPNGTRQTIYGTLDSLIFDFEKNRFCVVDYKTDKTVDRAAQLDQVALYSYILKRQKKLPIDSAIYDVWPEFKQHYYYWEQLEKNLHNLTPHKLQKMQEWLDWESPNPNPPPPTDRPYLCEICPQKEKCQVFFNVPENQFVGKAPSWLLDNSKESTITIINASSKRISKQNSEADAIGQEFVKVLEFFRIKVDRQETSIGPALTRVKLKLHPRAKVASLLNMSADLQVQMGLPYPPRIWQQGEHIIIDLQRKDRQIVKLEKYIQPQQLPLTATLKIAIGINLDGELVEANLSDPHTSHFLVGGSAGSGKTEFLRSLLLSLLWRHPPEHLKIVLIDPKKDTFPEFETIPWLYAPIVKKASTAIELMSQLVIQMQQRYHLFDLAGCADINAYNQKVTRTLPRIVCIFDEYADFMAEKEIRNALESTIRRLGAMARAVGIHLIVATQHLDAEVVTPPICSNLPGRVAFRTASEADSTIVLGGDEKAAAYLLGKGDLLYQVGAASHRLQSLLATIIEFPHQ